MNKLLTQVRSTDPFLKLSFEISIGVITMFLISIPVLAHHPFEGRPPETFSSIDGLISGLAHPLLGIDHFLFLFSIGLVGALTSKRWVPLLLSFGLLGTIVSLTQSIALPSLEIIVSLSLLASAGASIGLINPKILLPLIACHGYVLGQSVIGAEQTPLLTYLTGLLISEIFIIYIGITLLGRCMKYKKIFAAILSGIGITFTYATIVG